MKYPFLVKYGLKLNILVFWLQNKSSKGNDCVGNML